MLSYPPEIVAARAELDPLFNKLYRIDLDWNGSYEAKKELEAKGSEIVDVLVKEFWLVAYSQTYALVDLLGQTGDARAYHMLMTALGHFHMHIRETAARGLAKIGDPRAVPEMVNACHRAGVQGGGIEPSHYESNILSAICQLGTPALVELLKLVAKRRDNYLEPAEVQDWGIAAEAIVILMRIRPEDLFTQLFKEGQIQVIGKEPLEIRLETHRYWGINNLKVKEPQEFSSLLLDLMVSEDSFLRQAGAISIGLAGFTQAIPLLLETLNTDQNESVIVHTISALGRLKVAEAVELIANQLSKIELWPKYVEFNIDNLIYSPGSMIMRALENIGTPDALQVLDSEPTFHQRMLARRPHPYTKSKQ